MIDADAVLKASTEKWAAGIAELATERDALRAEVERLKDRLMTLGDDVRVNEREECALCLEQMLRGSLGKEVAAAIRLRGHK